MQILNNAAHAHESAEPPRGESPKTNYRLVIHNKSLQANNGFFKISSHPCKNRYRRAGGFQNDKTSHHFWRLVSWHSAPLYNQRESLGS